MIEVDDEVRSSLRRIGLGSRYHAKQLEDYGEKGAELKAWVLGTDFRADVFAGYGRSLWGSIHAHDTFMVLARACYLRGVPSKIVSLSVLVHEVSGELISTDLEEAQALFISPLYRPDFKQPLTEYQRLAVEDFLMERMDNARAIFTISTSPLAEAKLWWSETLITRLSQMNTEVHV